MADTEPPAPARTAIAAGALFFDDSDRVLLVKPSYKPGWEIPGGGGEPGEPPLAACVREVAEELGLAPPIGRLLAVDWEPGADGAGKLVFIFDGGVLRPDLRAGIRLQAEELTDYAFHSPSSVPDLIPQRRALRIAAAIEARSAGATRYLHDGLAP